MLHGAAIRNPQSALLVGVRVMPIIALANQKGGVGKTTTAVNLGAGLAARGRRVLIVDLDAQANATSALGVRAPAERTSYEVLLGLIPAADAVVPAGADGLWLLPSSPALAGADVELVPLEGRELFLRRSLRDPEGGIGRRFDFVLIDCPPSLGLLTINALCAADEVIVPVQCEYLALEGLGQLARTLERVRRQLNPALRLRGLVMTMFDARTKLAADVVREVRGHFPQTFQTVIPRSVRLSEAPSHGRTILAYDPSSRGARAYRDLAAELIEHESEAVSGRQ
jgi:chromosome partitioning protein